MANDIFVKLSDVGQVLLDYINSGEYKKAISRIDGHKENAFMCGLAQAGYLIMARCEKHEARMEDKVLDNLKLEDIFKKG